MPMHLLSHAGAKLATCTLSDITHATIQTIQSHSDGQTVALAVLRTIRPVPATPPVALLHGSSSSPDWLLFINSLTASPNGAKAALVAVQGPPELTTPGRLILAPCDSPGCLAVHFQADSTGQAAPDPVVGRKRTARAEDAAPPAGQPQVMPEATPQAAVLRDMAMQALSAAFANAVASHWHGASTPGATKSGKACMSQGLLIGLQALQARWLFRRLLERDQSAQPSQAHDDPLLPQCAGEPDSLTVGELCELGIGAHEATSIVQYFEYVARVASDAVRNCAAHLPPGWNDDSAGVRLMRASPGMLRLQWTCPSEHLVVQASSAAAKAIAELPWLASAPFDLPSARVPQDAPRPGAHLSAMYRGVAERVSETEVHIPLATRSVCMTISDRHYQKLRALYSAAAAAQGAPVEPARMHTRMFCMAAVYETLSGNSSGFQGALSPRVFDELERTLGITHEGFASPFNCYLPNFCSLAPHTDRFFGSVGSFWKQQFNRAGGVEVNPPFVNETMNAAATVCLEALQAAQAGGYALTFMYVGPGWDDSQWAMQLSASPFLTCKLNMAKGSHEYKDGVQWRANREAWLAKTRSLWFVLQSPAAAAATQERIGDANLASLLHSAAERKLRADDSLLCLSLLPADAASVLQGAVDV